ncbi:MBL fold metallo-hydrolase [Nitrosococcus halophilus]|nr:MBL fold metallo-hydrolase [Nitrosococcus halophilus]
MNTLPEDFPGKQWVCTACGYNMIGEMPDVCPFCGAYHDKFVTWEEGETAYRVTPKTVADQVTQLLSVPRLGLEHAAYRVDTTAGAVWIDSPSAFNRDLESVTDIYFTHKDFLGASNQYRALWNARVHLHQADAIHPLAAAFPVDDRFSGDFQENGIEAFHIGGHSPGWTAYFFGNVLFACDYAFPPGPRMRLNPFGPRNATRKCGARLLELVANRKPSVVCGYNYVADGAEWHRDFENALKR